MINFEPLENFIKESNKIEGILDEVTTTQRLAYEEFLKRDITLGSLKKFVKLIEPRAKYRDKVSITNVIIDRHRPIDSGPEVNIQLTKILNEMRLPSSRDQIWALHVRYETLHPFTDGNGRSGRALWLKQMLDNSMSHRVSALGFLHEFYYQTLHSINKNKTIF